MTKEEKLKNSIGFQFQFYTYSGLPMKEAVDNCFRIATEYATQFRSDGWIEERFKMPTSQQLIEFAILFNEENNNVVPSEMADMVAMCEFILDRLHEHGNCMTKSTKEIEIESELPTKPNPKP